MTGGKSAGFQILTCVILLGAGAFWAGADGYKYPYSPFKDRNPLKPLVNEQGKITIKERKGISNFTLQGIMYSSKGSEVIINNMVYKEGDVIDGYKIKKIDAYKVIFQKKGEEFVLKWEE